MISSPRLDQARLDWFARAVTTAAMFTVVLAMVMVSVAVMLPAENAMANEHAGSIWGKDDTQNREAFHIFFDFTEITDYKSQNNL